MEISGVDLLQSLSRIYETTSSTSSSSSVQGSASLQSGSCSESLDISVFGKLRSAISQMSDEDKQEMMAFHETMMEAVKSGTFDASEMAANAPEALKTFAEENGIDLESALEDEAAMMEKRASAKNAPLPPPPDMYGSNGYGTSSSSQDLTLELLKQLIAGEDSEETLIADIGKA